MIRKITPIGSYKHQCYPKGWRGQRVCKLCAEHEEKLKRHLRGGRLRVRIRRGIVDDRVDLQP